MTLADELAALLDAPAECPMPSVRAAKVILRAVEALRAVEREIEALTIDNARLSSLLICGERGCVICDAARAGLNERPSAAGGVRHEVR